MPVHVKELIEKTDVKEDVEAEIAGIKTLTWDVTNFDKNVEQINNKLETFFVHINEQMSRLDEISTHQSELETAVKKEQGDASRDPWFQLFESSKIEKEILFRVIGYLAIEFDVLNECVPKLAALLEETKRYGALKQKAETELQILGDMKNHFVATLDAMQKNYFAAVNEFERRLINMSRAQSSTSIPTTTETEISGGTLEAKFKALERKMQEMTAAQGQKPGAILTQKMIALVRDEGVTDKLEIAEKLNISPAQVAALGFKKILEKYGPVTTTTEEKSPELLEEETATPEETEG